jgi:uncharacterized membrane protein YhfC
MDLQFITHFLSGFLMIVVPVGLAILLTRLWKLSWRFWLVGAAVFILSQVGHIPFNNVMTILLNKTALAAWPKNAQTVFNLIFLGLSAGLFEEFSRYAMFRWWLKDGHSSRKAVLAGAGHGGAEAILVGCLALAAFFQLSAYRNIDLTGIIPPAQLDLARRQVAEYWSSPLLMNFLPLLERVLTIPVQISLSMIVLQAFVRKQFYWVGLAVFYHALINSAALFVYISYGAISSEIVLGIITLASLAIIIGLWRPEPTLSLPDVTPVFPAIDVEPQQKSIEVTSENLENTRFQ